MSEPNTTPAPAEAPRPVARNPVHPPPIVRPSGNAAATDVTPAPAAVEPPKPEAAPVAAAPEPKPEQEPDALARAARRLAEDRLALDRTVKATKAETEAAKALKAEADRVLAVAARAKEDPLAVFDLVAPTPAEKHAAIERMLAALATYEAPSESELLETRVLDKVRAEQAAKEADEKKAREAAEAEALKAAQSDTEAKIAAARERMKAEAVADQVGYELVNLCTESGMLLDGKAPLDHAWAALEEHHAATGEVLKFSTVLAATEDLLREKYRSLFARSKSLGGAAPAAPGVKPTTPAVSQPSGSPPAERAPSTLNTRGAADGPVLSRAERGGPQTQAERMAAIAERLRTRLNAA